MSVALICLVSVMDMAIESTALRLLIWFGVAVEACNPYESTLFLLSEELSQ